MKQLFASKMNEFNNGRMSLQEIEEFRTEIISVFREKTLIIYGAGVAGRTILQELLKSDINIECFIDRRADTLIEVEGVKVYHPNHLAMYNSDDVIVMISIDPQIVHDFRTEVEDRIEQFCPSCYEITYGRDFLAVLRYKTCRVKLENGRDFSICECLDCGAEGRNCPIFIEYLRRTREIEDRRNLKNKYNKFFGYICGKVCTLRCENCCELVPYYHEKSQVCADILLRDCKRLAAASQFNLFIELVGGEPFLHLELPEILEELLKIPNVGYIKVFTNGTVIPSDKLIGVLKNKRLVVVISNYMDTITGKLADNLKATRKRLEDENIPYIFSFAQTWLDFPTKFEYVGKKEGRLEKDFEDCYLAECKRLYNGLLFRCPHHYAGVQMGKLDGLKEEFLDIWSYDSVSELSEGLYEFLSVPYLEACKYCTLPYYAEEVPAAKQL